MRIRRYFRRTRWDAERAAEIEQYLAAETDDNIARGMPPAEARLAALRKIGNPAAIREEIYRMNTIAFLETSWRNVVYGLRSLRSNPGFTAVAIISLALGIGANTAIFSLVDALLLRSLPVPHPEQLVQLAVIQTDTPGAAPTAGFSFPLIEAFRERSQVFAGIFGENLGNTADVLIDGHTEVLHFQPVSGDVFQVLGVEPVLGGAFTQAQDRPGAEPAAVISYGYWQRRFALDPAVLGKKLVFRNAVHTIIGVAPPRFTGVEVESAPDLWLPFTSTMAPVQLFGPEAHGYQGTRLIARLKPGVTAAQALPSLEVLYSQILREEHANRRARDVQHRISEAQFRHANAKRIALLPGGRGLSDLRRLYTEPLLILMIVVGLVLLIACANIANLLLARGLARQREIAIRLAIGAGRARLVSQLLTENLLLAALGAMAGLVFAEWAGRTLVAMVVSASRSTIQFHLDLHILAFTAAVAVLTALLFGLGPALRATAAQGIRPHVRVPIAKVLVASQVALSLMLVLGAVLFVATLQKLVHTDLGFRRDSLLVAALGIANPQASSSDQVLTAWRDALDRVAALPGVQSVSVSDNAVFSGGTVSDPVYAETGTQYGSNIQRISPGYFETMQTPILEGRSFRWQDTGSTPKVAVVNESLAHHLFPDGHAVGHRVGWTARTASDLEIVGVARDVKWQSVRTAPPPFIYVPVFQPAADPYSARGIRFGFLAVRTAVEPSALKSAIQSAIQGTHAFQARLQVTTQDEMVGNSMNQERLLARLSGFFGLVGLALAAVGLYGLMSYAVSRRTGEIGIRMALGARPADLVRMVLGETATLVLAGIAAGAAMSLLLSRFIEKFLYGVTRTDPAMTVLAAALLMSAALLAAGLPALRAARVQPTTALRHE